MDAVGSDGAVWFRFGCSIPVNPDCGLFGTTIFPQFNGIKIIYFNFKLPPDFVKCNTTANHGKQAVKHDYEVHLDGD